ncbi:uroporphyrinogen decarboxylase [Glutamicibacter soli]|uniref:Uroporphyrinogen decarboxylase n=1 Tax=Glutamicibacter soli TaxID=453836 RepID=A0A365YPI4_9MICC|nr:MULTISPECIES: uroporphyrinogen decarboxylase [Micrococcaceae]ALD64404.1 uroporphyrinogen decarboxylase [Arthrobacter sp. LS16]ALQ30321.1 uroporphyrinogen decarboxylase [Arthrobacter sp. YC-RL1]KLI88369.1 uroporphyrinogen decarboxylase [Arthrobacter sp. YC-RL1]NAZ14501.1 uroporphyrinogen decarboxylase [Glutamicibacter soli]RBM04277.1 uroporphyrinogen decarboxylase [Glutamicibacter soli]
MTLSQNHPMIDGRTQDSALIQALTGREPSHHPVWFMRQAGRSLPEYLKLREGVSMLDSCLDPAMASEITLQPVRRHKVDAGIFFSDIVIPLRLAGIGVDIVPGVGPVLDTPIRTAEQVAALPELTDEALEPIRQAVALTVAELGSTPLIGFAGAPFTVAAYMVEGKPSRDHLGPRTMMHSEPEVWDALMKWAADASGKFLRAQVEAGASAAQLFDSWAGSLSLPDYQKFAAPYSARSLDFVRDLGVPLIHFGTGTGELLTAMRDAGVDAVGVDYRIPLPTAIERLGQDVSVQGNIDPALLSAPWEVLEAHVREVVASGKAARGHVVNLGHGVPPTTDPSVLTRVVELIHSL